jgi:hypothetical protein
METSLVKKRETLPDKEHPLLAIELNLAKFAPFIFAPSHTPRSARARVKTWAIDLGDGNEALARILIEPAEGETLNTLDHRTYLALQKLWWALPKNPEDKSTWLTLKELTRTMNLTWGKTTLKLLKASLRRLRKVPITWERSFYDKRLQQLKTLEEPVNILAKLRLMQAQKVKTKEQARNIFAATDGRGLSELEASFFRFNEYIEKNLEHRHTKPIFFDVAIRIRGEVALGLYSFLDVVMADKVAWERRLTELLRDDLHVQGIYRRPAERQRLILRAAKELQAKSISTGTLGLQVAKTRDGEDYKLVVRKNPFRPKKTLPPPDRQKSYLVDQILDLTEDGHSRGYYLQKVRELPEETVWMLLSETKQAHLEGRIHTTKARYFTDLVERHLGHREK